MKELTIPAAAHEDPNSLEVLRVWVANQRQHVSLKTGVWEDPATWGLMLSDLARHIANAYHQEDGLDFSQTLARIKAGFDVEMESPTDFPKGEVKGN